MATSTIPGGNIYDAEETINIDFAGLCYVKITVRPIDDNVELVLKEASGNSDGLPIYAGDAMTDIFYCRGFTVTGNTTGAVVTQWKWNNNK